MFLLILVIEKDIGLGLDNVHIAVSTDDQFRTEEGEGVYCLAIIQSIQLCGWV
jgi:hypothetical protein